MYTQERVLLGKSVCVKITRLTVSAVRVSLSQLVSVLVCVCVCRNDIPMFLPFHRELETKAEGSSC